MPFQIAILALVIAAAALLYWSPRRVTVFEFERGLRYRRGRFIGTLQPGTHWVTRRGGTITKVDVRPYVLAIPGQELLTSDGIGVKVSLIAGVEVVDPAAAINQVQNYTTTVYALIQVALRQIVSSRSLEELIAGRTDVGLKVLEASAQPALAFGLKVTSIDVRDLMLPGDLKRIFAQEVAARKEGLAALEKARGETAALRNLANAARMIEDNPALMQLRLLQQLGATGGNTVVLGDTGIIPVAKRERRPAKNKDSAAEKDTPT
ncbi:MAG TPA: slipin family protein [Candidatus Dormibacteraeota bacterium]|jgi:regulator of protease activity HflC (stomatin/prohibitin superfamily)